MLAEMAPASHSLDSGADDPIRHAQRGDASLSGAVQHVASDGADAGDRGEHRFGSIVDLFLMEVDDAPGIRQVVRHERDAAYRQGRVVPGLGKLVVGAATHDTTAKVGD